MSDERIEASPVDVTMVSSKSILELLALISSSAVVAFPTKTRKMQASYLSLVLFAHVEIANPLHHNILFATLMVAGNTLGILGTQLPCI